MAIGGSARKTSGESWRRAHDHGDIPGLILFCGEPGLPIRGVRKVLRASPKSSAENKGVEAGHFAVRKGTPFRTPKCLILRWGGRSNPVVADFGEPKMLRNAESEKGHAETRVAAADRANSKRNRYLEATGTLDGPPAYPVWSAWPSSRCSFAR